MELIKVRLDEGEHSVSRPEGTEHYIEGDTFEIPSQALDFIKHRVTVLGEVTPKRGPGRPPKPPEVPVITTSEASALDENASLSVNELNLPLPVKAILKDAGYFSVEQLYEETEETLVKLNGIGRARAELICQQVDALRN